MALPWLGPKKISNAGSSKTAISSYFKQTKIDKLITIRSLFMNEKPNKTFDVKS